MPQTPLQKLAYEIAVDDAISTIECGAPAIRDSRGRLLWYEIDPTDARSGWYVSRAVRFLALAGLLRRRPNHRNHVNVRRPR